MFSQDDDNQGVVLGVLFGLIALVIALVIGVSIYKTNSMATPATKPAAVAAAPAAEAVADGASVKVVGGVVKFYFASGKADLAAGGNEALAEVVRAVAAGKTAVISGFHDATGDPAKNAELAKQRAFVVRDALKALGVAEDKVELKKPEQTLATGSDGEARRVEVAVQ
jgi:outer membrane protein OmpA-like peptidoglycan-associated protein